jgi:hypothetical protein
MAGIMTDTRPMKDTELGHYVCVAGCLHSHRTITSDGVWVRSPDPLNPDSDLYSSAHRDCHENRAATTERK